MCSSDLPGITNFVTAIAAAYWAHSPVVAITPEAGSLTAGLGGFQETEQLPIFSKITKWQTHVMSPTRLAELTGRAFHYAMHERGPTQVNIPRDHFYGEIEVEIPRPFRVERGPGDRDALREAAKLLANAAFPVIVAGGGVSMGGGVAELVRLGPLFRIRAGFRDDPLGERHTPRTFRPSIHRARADGGMGWSYCGEFLCHAATFTSASMAWTSAGQVDSGASTSFGTPVFACTSAAAFGSPNLVTGRH